MGSSLLNIFVNVHILVILAMTLSFFLRLCCQRKILNVSAKNEMTLNNILILGIFVLPLIAYSGSERFSFQTVTKTVAALSYKEFDAHLTVPLKENLILGSDPMSPVIPMDYLKNGILFILFLTILISIFQILSELKIFYRIAKKSIVVRSIGSTRIAFSDQIQIPFSFLFFRTAWVILPTRFLGNKSKMRMSILHELQHHRQADTRWIYLWQLMKAAVGVNPALKIWQGLVSEVQELKVDENLVDQRKVTAVNYARCLIEVAETVVTEEKRFVCATSLVFFPDRQQLKRRIESMLNRKMGSKVAAFVIAGVFVSSMTTFALGTRKLIGTRSVTLAEAEVMAAVARKDSQFPIVVNELVLVQLNRFLGTKQGRDFMKGSIKRMDQYRSIIETKIKMFPHKMPLELLAVPLIESGYVNMPSLKNKYKAAGLWQFIPETALVYGLRVDVKASRPDVSSVEDERLDVALSTDAALNYIWSNQLRFHDWLLAMAAYNMGENNLKTAIDKMGTDDVWQLVRAGYEGDKAYLAKLEAAILILKNPDSLN